MREILELIVACITVATTLLFAMTVVGAVMIGLCTAGAGSFLVWCRKRRGGTKTRVMRE